MQATSKVSRHWLSRKCDRLYSVAPWPLPRITARALHLTFYPLSSLVISWRWFNSNQVPPVGLAVLANCSDWMPTFCGRKFEYFDRWCLGERVVTFTWTVERLAVTWRHSLAWDLTQANSFDGRNVVSWTPAVSWVSVRRVCVSSHVTLIGLFKGSDSGAAGRRFVLPVQSPSVAEQRSEFFRWNRQLFHLNPHSTSSCGPPSAGRNACLQPGRDRMLPAIAAPPLQVDSGEWLVLNYFIFIWFRDGFSNVGWSHWNFVPKFYFWNFPLKWWSARLIDADGRRHSSLI